MLKMIVAAAERVARLNPDNLRADLKPAGLQRIRHYTGELAGVPNVGDVALEEFPSLAPVGTLVVEYHALGARVATIRPIAPRGVILHAVRRISRH